MDIEQLKTKAEKAEIIAARERASVARTLSGARPGGRRWSKRVRAIQAKTQAVAIELVTVAKNPTESETVRHTLHFTRIGYAGHCTDLAICARRTYETALALSGKGD